MLELFSGSKVMSSTFKEKGWSTYTVDLEESCWPDLCADINNVTAKDIIELFGSPNIIWASPPCTCFSIAALNKHHFKKIGERHIPVTQESKDALKLVKHTLELIEQLRPMYYFIENPMGFLRKMPIMKPYPRYNITYCTYGSPVMKPTDIWTNHPAPGFKKPCRAGDSCHISSPMSTNRGVRDELTDPRLRAKIPAELCEHIVSISEQKTIAPILKQELLVYG